MIENNIVRLGRDQAMPHLKSKLNGYRRGGRPIYIGVTANPDARWMMHHAYDGWAKMVVLYKAFSADIASDMERELIDYAHQCNFLSSPANIGPGGEGIGRGGGPRYLYVLVG